METEFAANANRKGVVNQLRFPEICHGACRLKGTAKTLSRFGHGPHHLHIGQAALIDSTLTPGRNGSNIIKLGSNKVGSKAQKCSVRTIASEAISPQSVVESPRELYSRVVVALVYVDTSGHEN